MENKKIQLTAANLLKHGENVLTREWKSPAGLTISEKYIIWDTCKMNRETDPEVLKRAQNKKRMFLLTCADGEVVSMKQL